jgi:hypothetical protein
MAKRATKRPKARAVSEKRMSRKKQKPSPVEPVGTTHVTGATEENVVPLSSLHARPARALVGWLSSDVAQSLLAGPTCPPPYSPEIVKRAERSFAAVARRIPLAASPTRITDAPKELADHIKELEAQPFYRPFLKEGWRVRMADLRCVRALQTLIHCDHADERTRLAIADDLASLAAITIPISRPKELVAIESSPDGRRWTLTCRNPQLRILAPYSADLDDTGYKTKVFGFQTELSHSLVQVVHWRGVNVLRDGYHRAYGLLARGIVSVPVVYRELPDNQLPALGPSIFDPLVYLGDRPPLLTDYLDDQVSARVEVRRLQKTFVVQAVEIDSPVL